MFIESFMLEHWATNTSNVEMDFWIVNYSVFCSIKMEKIAWKSGFISKGEKIDNLIFNHIFRQSIIGMFVKRKQKSSSESDWSWNLKLSVLFFCTKKYYEQQVFFYFLILGRWAETNTHLAGENGSVQMLPDAGAYCSARVRLPPPHVLKHWAKFVLDSKTFAKE